MQPWPDRAMPQRPQNCWLDACFVSMCQQ
jgi:hypothetical protein